MSVQAQNILLHSDVFRQECCEVVNSRKRVLFSKMDEKKAQHARRKCDEEACRSVRRSVVLGWNHVKESVRIPDVFSVDDLPPRHNPGV